MQMSVFSNRLSRRFGLGLILLVALAALVSACSSTNEDQAQSAEHLVDFSLVGYPDGNRLAFELHESVGGLVDARYADYGDEASCNSTDIPVKQMSPVPDEGIPIGPEDVGLYYCAYVAVSYPDNTGYIGILVDEEHIRQSGDAGSAMGVDIAAPGYSIVESASYSLHLDFQDGGYPYDVVNIRYADLTDPADCHKGNRTFGEQSNNAQSHVRLDSIRAKWSHCFRVQFENGRVEFFNYQLETEDLPEELK